MSRPKKNKKLQIWKRDNFKCCFCGENLINEFKNNYPSSTTRITVEHLAPRSQGGKNSLENLVTCCRSCNQRRAKKLGLGSLSRIY